MVNDDPAKEWGLPDWRDAGSYSNSFGCPDEWNDTRWRWEFKRRQPEYRGVFDEYVRQGRDGTIVQDHVEEVDRDGYRKMVTAGETKSASSEHSAKPGFIFVADQEHRAKFRMFFLPNPRLSDQPNQALQFGDRLSTAQRGPDGLLVGNANYHFDLTLPLKPQLKRCEEILLGIQGQWRGKQLRQQKRDDKWLQYLRALDAHECGANYGQMLLLIPEKNQVPQSSRDTLDAAIALRNKL